MYGVCEPLFDLATAEMLVNGMNGIELIRRKNSGIK